ncbi:hypothetical protein ACFU53_03225 [Streptomyces sp. NPDC057474]|uniref:hypothetical protein n=1 Tax=Streptomyces sp. NPDC057474 TaxID=3346144 RepID=UPI0036ABA5EB
MALFGRRGAAVPRLTPELDDVELGRVRKRLTSTGASSSHALGAAVMEQLLDGTGTDWDRRAHRLAVLADVAPPSVQHSWVTWQPRNPDALTLFAWGVMLRAREHQQLNAAEAEGAIQACMHASAARPFDPNPWVVRLGLLRIARRPPNEVFPLWAEITRRDPWHREAHLQMLGYLSPDECGSRGQVMDFLDEVRALAPERTPTAGLALSAFVDHYHATLDQGGLNALTAAHLWERMDAAQLLDSASVHWPLSGYLSHAAALADLNFLAYALVEARRPKDAAEAFRAIKGVVTADPWGRASDDPVGTFVNYWQKAGS